MKSKMVSSEKEWIYPCFGKSKSTGMIVLFTEKGKGTVVCRNDASIVFYRLGQYSDTWDMNFFELYQGNVLIEG
jgi:hypothetical protein